MITPPLKWHGGKNYLASEIIKLIPPHIHYVEPYFGGGAVLLHKNPEGISEVVNDIDSVLTNFWRVLQDVDSFSEFHRVCLATPFSETEYDESQTPHPSSDFWNAHKFFIRCRQSLAGRMDTFAPLSRTRTRRGMNEQASAWINAVDGLPEVHERLRRVVILCHDALNVIQQQDGKDTFFYLDPPYLHETRVSKNVYEHEMSVSQHVDLLNLLCKIKGKFLLSGYENEIYGAFANHQHWYFKEFDLPNNSAGGKEKRRMKEVLWANYNIGDKQCQLF